MTPLFVVAGTALLLVVLPYRFAVLTYLVSLHVLPALGTADAPDLGGWITAATAVALPMMLAFRAYRDGARLPKMRAVGVAWFAFILYVGVAVAWSSYPAGGVKLLGFLVGYSVLVWALAWAFRLPRDGYMICVGTLVSAMVIAFYQSFVLGNPVGGDVGRFTSFSGAQEFGLFLATSIPVLLACSVTRSRESMPVSAALLVCVVGVLLNGSRTALMLVVLALVGGAVLLRRSVRSAIMRGPGRTLIGGVCLVFLSVVPLGQGLSGAGFGQRSGDLVRLVTGDEEATEIGTLRFRLHANRAVSARLADQSNATLLFGRGTSSAGEFVLGNVIRREGYDSDSVDTNRLLHNEYLRSLYEWGLLGTGMLAVVVLIGIAGVLGGARRVRRGEYRMLVYGLGMVLVTAVGNNVFAAQGRPFGGAVAMLIGTAWAATRASGRAPARGHSGANRPSSVSFRLLAAGPVIRPSRSGAQG